jgi:predicted nucleic acid-binding protein
LRGNTALDSSVLIEYLTGTALGQQIKRYFEQMAPDERAYCSLHTLSETYYVLCRLRGTRFAAEKLQEMLRSELVEVAHSVELGLKVGEIKCARAISLADCSCIATAMLTHSQAVFAKPEEDLAVELERKRFDVDLVFLSHLTG